MSEANYTSAFTSWFTLIREGGGEGWDDSGQKLVPQLIVWALFFPGWHKQKVFREKESDTSVSFLYEWKHPSALCLILLHWNALRLKAMDMVDMEKVQNLLVFFPPFASL